MRVGKGEKISHLIFYLLGSSVNYQGQSPSVLTMDDPRFAHVATDPRFKVSLKFLIGQVLCE